LFPVRVQVKFVENSPANAYELRVRLYPDQLNVTSHQDGLNADEIASGQAYWRQDGEAWRQPGASPRPTLHSLASWRVLVAKHGAPRGAWIVEQTTPTNLPALSQGITAGNAPEPTFAPLTVPADAWQPAKLRAMPDYFTVTLYRQHESATAVTDPHVREQLLGNLAQPYSPETVTDLTTEFLYPYLSVATRPRSQGLDTLLASFGQNGEQGLTETITGVDDRMAWLVDFDQAVAEGMAVVIPLSAEDYRLGFKRLVVLGVKTGGDPAAQVATVLDVFRDQAHTSGLALVPQGTPTNNTTGEASGFGSDQPFDADDTFPLLAQAAAYPAAYPTQRQQALDGQRLSEALGLPATALAAVEHATDRDVQEAQQMNRILFPATYGYFLEEMMRPLFSPAAVDWIRTFFAEHVLGRGALPAFRVGNEPYGVLPTTRFSAWQAPASLGTYGQQLAETLRRLDVTWTERLNQVGNYPVVDPSGVPFPPQPPSRQNLLTTLGADATSVEFYQRYLLGPNLIDTLNGLAGAQDRSLWPGLQGTDGTVRRRSFGRFDVEDAPANPLHQEFLKFMGARGAEDILGLRSAGVPRIFEQAFQSGYAKLVHTFADEAARPGSLGQLIDELPFSETRPLQPFPGTTLNYIQWLATRDFEQVRVEDFSDVATDGAFTPPNSLLYRLLRQAVLLQYWDAAMRTLGRSGPQRQEQEFFHLLDQQPSRWQVLYETYNNQPLHEYLQQGKGSEGPKLQAYLADVNALALLPTARLERLLAEHLDLGNHRLDAWKTGQVVHRLAELRRAAPTGLYYGAFGWLEDVTQQDRSSAGSDGVREDPDNLGFIHAPSINQGVAAAILRQGYKSRQFTTDPADPAAGRMAVNLSSERVRHALEILDGIRGGQTLGALLGQHFERSLFQHPGTAGGRPYAAYLPAFRARFPYAQEKSTAGPDSQAANSTAEQAVRQVVDGLALVQASSLGYPYGADLPADAGLAAAVSQEVAALRDTVDALGDLTVSESIFQATLGNADQATAILESVGKGKFPVNPDVINPPRAGKTLTQRVLLHLPGDDAALSEWGTGRTPRARAEPGLNRWLASLFGSPASVELDYEYQVGAGTSATTVTSLLGLDEVGIQPIDLLYLLDADALRAGSALDSLVTQAIRALAANQVADPTATGTVTVKYATAGGQALRRLLPLANRLRQLLGSARPARPADLARASQLGPDDPADTLGSISTEEIQMRLTSGQTALQQLVSELPTASSATPLTSAQIRTLRSQLQRAVLFGIPEATAALGATADNLLQVAASVRTAASQRLVAVGQVLAGSRDDEDPASRYPEAGQALFGAGFRLSLAFTLTPLAEVAYKEAVANEAQLLAAHQANPLLLHEWLQGLARVREPLDHLEKVILLHELLRGDEPTFAPLTLHPAQLSAHALADDSWLGVTLPEGYQAAGDAVSLVSLRPPGYEPTGPQLALWLDEWTEVLPEAEQTTAVAFHYDQPNSEPAQSLLLVVSPHSETTSQWAYADLLGAVNETLDLAKKRTVEPDALAFTHLGQLLPALVAPVAQEATTLTLDFGRVNGTARFAETPLRPD
jgi:hypothetical protein